MAELCSECMFLRSPSTTWTEDVTPRSAASLASAAKRRRDEKVRLRLEQALMDRTAFGSLEGSPRHFEWCGAKLSPESGEYFWRAWQIEETCKKFRCANPGSSCTRCLDGEGPCDRGLNNVHSTAVTDRASAGIEASGLKNRTEPVMVSRLTRREEEAGCVVLGMPMRLQETAHVASTSQWSNYELVPDASHQPPQIVGDGFEGTFMIFGGPGAGKTHLFKHMLRQVLAHDSKPGCLLLDPKGSELSPWLADTMKDLGRGDQFRTVNADSTLEFNVLGRDRPPRELGRLLADVVLTEAGAVQDAWLVLLTDLLESSVVVLSHRCMSGLIKRRTLTPKLLLDEVLYPVDVPYTDGSTRPTYPIELSARALRKDPDATTQEKDSAQRILEFLEAEAGPRRFVRQMIEKSLGDLRDPKWGRLSSDGDHDIYRDIIGGQVRAVSVGYSNPAFQRSLLTLMKAIFQQYALEHIADRSRSDPFFVLASDEYAQIVTEGSSGLVSDAAFFSQSREAGCLSLLALQSLATAKSRFPPAVRDRWEGIMGNVSGRIFMKLNDHATAQLASELVGKRQVTLKLTSTGVSAQSGRSSTDSYTVVERHEVPDWVFTSRMKRGEALAHGTFDGENPVSCFFKVPPGEKTRAGNPRP